ncbi:MAG: transporter substrate-binding domain-containing protein [Clostridia bacterium]|nr:transporter substrate-binding domain-containing protein [Clostridia bacterium]
MKRNLIRIISLILVAVFALGALASCGTKKEEEEKDQLAAIQEAGKFVVGIEGAYPPFNYHDDSGELTGFDVEVAKAVAEKLGVTAEFVEAPWDSLLAGVDSGRFDTVINCVSVSDERKEKYDFSDPYVYSPTQILVRTANDSIKSIDDLSGKKLAGNSTNVLASWYESLGVELVPIDTSSEAINLLLSDRVDFLSFSGITFSSYLDEHPDTDIKVAFNIDDAEQQVAIPIRKGETRLLDSINQALEELREDGTIVALSEEFLKSDFTVSASE